MFVTAPAGLSAGNWLRTPDPPALNKFRVKPGAFCGLPAGDHVNDAISVPVGVMKVCQRYPSAEPLPGHTWEVGNDRPKSVSPFPVGGFMTTGPADDAPGANGAADASDEPIAERPSNNMLAERTAPARAVVRARSRARLIVGDVSVRGVI